MDVAMYVSTVEVTSYKPVKTAQVLKKDFKSVSNRDGPYSSWREAGTEKAALHLGGQERRSRQPPA